jgi:hypothetical protein
MMFLTISDPAPSPVGEALVQVGPSALQHCPDLDLDTASGFAVARHAPPGTRNATRPGGPPQDRLRRGGPGADRGGVLEHLVVLLGDLRPLHLDLPRPRNPLRHRESRTSNAGIDPLGIGLQQQREAQLRRSALPGDELRFVADECPAVDQLVLVNLAPRARQLHLAARPATPKSPFVPA